MKLFIADAFPERYIADLKAAGYSVEYAPGTAGDALAARVKDIDVLVVRSTKVDRKIIESAPDLSLILRAGAGYDTIDVAAASERGIYVSNCPGKNSVAVAELTMGLILAVDRRIPHATGDLRAGKWNKKEYGKAEGLKGKTLGICGTGPIGREVAQRALAFEMNVLAWSRSFTPEKAEELGIEHAATLQEIAEKSDIVSVHLAQTKDTKKLFGESFFARMKPGAMFINTSRGGLHDQAALVEAMKTKGIRAGLDVFDPEPSAGTADFSDPLFALPGFVGTHHIGASTEQAQDAIAAETVRICREFMATGRAPNVVNVEQHAPAKCQLVVRHYDKVGVLASVLGIIRNYEVNVEDMTNTIFQGAKAAVAVIRLGSEPSPQLIAEIAGLKDQIIQVEAKTV
jgi:D-3-phosphoglycerate dehydrogenase / 2-oxoglutarate reductase